MMGKVTIELPSVLDPVVNGDRTLTVDAETLPAALAALTDRYPALKVHLYDETGGFRQHVLCFHNQTNIRWMDSINVPLHDGDTITILQAVSGG
jgi:molybdopterin converting factor small subunit